MSRGPGGDGRGRAEAGDRLSHLGCWPAWGTLPWGLWGRWGAGGHFTSWLREELEMMCLSGFPGPPRPLPLSLQVFPWLTVPPGSCPWFLMIVTLLLRALNPKTPGSDSQPLPLKPCPPGGAALTSHHPPQSPGPQGGMEQFLPGRGVTLPAPASCTCPLWHTHSHSNTAGNVLHHPHTPLQVAHPSWGSGPKGSLAFTVADGPDGAEAGAQAPQSQSPSL